MGKVRVRSRARVRSRVSVRVKVKCRIMGKVRVEVRIRVRVRVKSVFAGLIVSGLTQCLLNNQPPIGRVRVRSSVRVRVRSRIISKVRVRVRVRVRVKSVLIGLKVFSLSTSLSLVPVTSARLISTPSNKSPYCSIIEERSDICKV
jgi:hypothetical protein